MATITLQQVISDVTTKSVLTITESERTSEKTVLGLSARTNLVKSGAFVGSNITLYGVVQISGNGMTAKSTTLTLKQNSENWNNTNVHTTNSNFEIDIPSNVTEITITYTCYYTDNPNSKMSGNALMNLTKLISQLNRFEGTALRNLEEPQTLLITQYDSNYTNNLILYYRDSDNNYTELGSWNNVVNGQQVQLNETQLANLYNLTKYNKFYSTTWKLITLNGTTELGYMTLPGAGLIYNADPIFSNFTYKDINPKTNEVTGNNQIIVNNVSTLEVTIPINNKAIAQKSAEMVSYLINDLSKDYSATKDVTVEIPQYTSRTIKVTAVDTRAKSTLIEKTITNFIDYMPVTVNATSATISRVNNSGEGTKISFSGNYWVGNFGIEDNSLEISYKYRLAGSTGNYTSGTTTIIPLIENGSYSVTDKAILGDTNEGFNTGNSYEIVIIVKDKLSVNEIVYTLNPGKNAIEIEGNKVIRINDNDTISGVITNSEVQLKDMNNSNVYPKIKRDIITICTNKVEALENNTDIPFNTIYSQCGDTNKLGVYDDGGVLIGAGVSKVLVSFIVNCQSNYRKWFYLKKNGAKVGDCISQEALSYHSSVYPPQLFDVKEGDYFQVLNQASQIVINKGLSNPKASFMTVEVIE